MAILNARTIAATAVYPENRLCCLVVGTNDLLKKSRARALHNRFAVVPWLAMTIAAARAYRLDILDGVYNDFKDEKGLREECQHGRTLGMDGKTLNPSEGVAVDDPGTMRYQRAQSFQTWLERLQPWGQALKDAKAKVTPKRAK